MTSFFFKPGIKIFIIGLTAILLIIPILYWIYFQALINYRLQCGINYDVMFTKFKNYEDKLDEIVKQREKLIAQYVLVGSLITALDASCTWFDGSLFQNLRYIVEVEKCYSRFTAFLEQVEILKKEEDFFHQFVYNLWVAFSTIEKDLRVLNHFEIEQLCQTVDVESFYYILIFAKPTMLQEIAKFDGPIELFKQQKKFAPNALADLIWDIEGAINWSVNGQPHITDFRTFSLKQHLNLGNCFANNTTQWILCVPPNFFKYLFIIGVILVVFLFMIFNFEKIKAKINLLKE